MFDRQALLNAPPRISDLHGDARRRVLVERARASEADWFESRNRPSLFARLLAMVSGSQGRAS